MKHDCPFYGIVSTQALRDRQAFEARVRVIDTYDPRWEDPEVGESGIRLHFEFAGEEKELVMLLQRCLRPGPHVAHYYCEPCDRLVIVFVERHFVCSLRRQATTLPAVEQGLVLGVPRIGLSFRTWEEEQARW